MSHRLVIASLLLALLPAGAGCPKRAPLVMHMPTEKDGAKPVEKEDPGADEPVKPEDIESFLAVADEAAPVEVKLLKPGKEPRRALRYAIEADSEQGGTLVLDRARAVVEVGGVGEYDLSEHEVASLDMTAEVLEVSDEGDVLYRFRFGEPRYEGAGATRMGEHLTGIEDLEGTVLIDGRGVVRATHVELLPTLSPQAGGMKEPMRALLTSLVVPLPEGEVGPGARWEVERQDTTLDDLATVVRSVYELRKVGEGEVTIRATHTWKQGRQAAPMRWLREGTGAEVLELRGGAREDVVLKLDRLLGRTQADGTMRARLRLRAQGRVWTLSVESKIRQQIAPAD